MMPILFPISLLALINHYITEKILFAYFYRKPPMYGNEINEGALRILLWAPIFMFSTCYWALGNRQIFFNESSAMEFKMHDNFPKHTLFNFSKGFDHSAILIVFVPLMIYFRTTVNAMRYVALRLNLCKLLDGIDLDYNIEIKIDEHLGNYWNCLKG